MSKDSRINERITAYMVVLISEDGTNRGEMLKTAAIAQARSLGLDLVEVSQGSIPTCKILDYGKVQYDRHKAERKQSHGQAQKGMRFKYKTDEHDLDIKRRKIHEFLAKGHTVQVSMIVKGRERYVDRGAAKQKFINFVKEFNPDLQIKNVSENEKGYNAIVSPSPVAK